MLKTKNLTKVFTTEEVETTALSNVNAEIQDGEFVAIMGPSGCGKSTFLHIAGMLDNPSNGEYFFMGEEVSRYSEKKRANLRKGNIGFVFQSFNLIDELTVFENVELPLLYLKLSASERKRRVNETLRAARTDAAQKPFPATNIRRAAAARGGGTGRHRQSKSDSGRRAHRKSGLQPW